METNKNGKVLYFHADGSIMLEAFYKNNMKEGIWKYYNPFGRLIAVEHYQNDDLIAAQY